MLFIVLVDKVLATVIHIKKRKRKTDLSPLRLLCTEIYSFLTIKYALVKWAYMHNCFPLPVSFFPHFFYPNLLWTGTRRKKHIGGPWVLHMKNYIFILFKANLALRRKALEMALREQSHLRKALEMVLWEQSHLLNNKYI